jgi:hypothetical protein
MHTQKKDSACTPLLTGLHTKSYWRADKAVEKRRKKMARADPAERQQTDKKKII